MVTPLFALVGAVGVCGMAGKEEGGWDGLVLMPSSWKVKRQNLRPAWAQVGSQPNWGRNINAVLMGCILCLQGTLNFHLPAQTQPINVRQWTSNGCRPTGLLGPGSLFDGLRNLIPHCCVAGCGP